MGQESIEETQRRLGLTALVADVEAPAPKPRSSRSGRVVAVVAGLAVLGAGAFAAAQFLPAAGIGSDEWTTYPGTWFEETEVVLANDSLEVTKAAGDALLAELMGELDAYGFEWSVYREGEVTPSSNGYRGDSMLYDYEADTMVGAVRLDDPSARADIIAIYTALMSEPGTTLVFDNEDITDESAEMYFGSTDRDEQALWSAWTYGEKFAEFDTDIWVYDSTVPTGDEFTQDHWVPDDSTATLFVRIDISSHFLLSESDREAFIAALEPYEGKTRPDYRE